MNKPILFKDRGYWICWQDSKLSGRGDSPYKAYADFWERNTGHPLAAFVDYLTSHPILP